MEPNCFIQEMLGHATLQATQIYIAGVDREAGGDPHGDARRRTLGAPGKHGEGLADDHDEAFEKGARDELLSALAAEAAEEEGD